jgi:hypothetical protein
VQHAFSKISISVICRGRQRPCMMVPNDSLLWEAVKKKFLGRKPDALVHFAEQRCADAGRPAAQRARRWTSSSHATACTRTPTAPRQMRSTLSPRWRPCARRCPPARRARRQGASPQRELTGGKRRRRRAPRDEAAQAQRLGPPTWRLGGKVRMRGCALAARARTAAAHAAPRRLGARLRSRAALEVTVRRAARRPTAPVQVASPVRAAAPRARW